MPYALFPSSHSRARLSRRAFFAVAGTAAAAATLGPTAPCFPQLPENRFDMRATRFAYADSRRSGATIERVLGATRCALDELKAHEHDSYYLSTSFGNTGPDGAGGAIGTWDCWYPNGRPKSNGQAYMNCAGFVVAVLEACGANCDIVGNYVGSAGYNRGNKSNLYRWIMYLNDHANLRTRFESKEALLSSGLLQKGDLIIADPRDWSVPGVDCHILFFWGDNPSHDRAWHSSNHAEGVVAGTCPGNMISKISAKSSDVYWLHVPLENVVKLVLEKRSAALSFADGSEGEPFYSLANARFSIFESCNQGQCSGLIAQFTTDERGQAELELAPNTDVWVREDAAPLGFCPWSAPMRLHVGTGEAHEMLRDEPQTVHVVVAKSDAEHGSLAQGHASLAGATFELIDSKGSSYVASTEKAEDGQWLATFPEIARGRIKLREARAPRGYLLSPLQGANNEGWVEIEAAPNQAVRCEAIPVQVSDRVIRGDIEGVKIFEPENDADDSTRPALEGAVFRIWLQDDGTLAEKGYNVKPIEDAQGNAVAGASGRALYGACMGDVKSGKDGRFSSKDLLANWSPGENSGQPRPECALPFGIYAIVEMFCPSPALRLAKPVTDIEIHAPKQTVFLTVEDRRISSPVRIRKCDAASGKSVLAAGTAIELLRQDESGNYRLVEFALRTPADSRISRFVIPESGIVQFPEKLVWGSYAIREVSTIAPYLVRKQPILFDVGKNHDWEESDIIEIDLPNEQTTGAIEGLKNDEETEAGVAGAVYEISAAHDIVSPDGTEQLHAGDVASIVQTDEMGAWRIEGLPLGMGEAEYVIAEKESPDGYLAERQEHRVVLTWENDTQAIVAKRIEIIETPTRVRIRKTDAETGEAIRGVEFEISAAAPHAESDDAVENEQNAAEAEPSSDEINAKDSKEPLAAKLAPEPMRLLTNDEGIIETSHLARGYIYTVEETAPRKDLGYVSSKERFSRYLSHDGRWYESAPLAADNGNQPELGDEIWDLALENDCTKLHFFKVDAKAFREAKNADGGAGSAERAAAQAHLEGGLFRLEDDEGNPVAPTNAGLDAQGWPAQGAAPVKFDHLRPDKRYWIVEANAPDGYTAEEQRTEVRIEDSTDVQVVVLQNDRNDALAKTLDIGPRIVMGAASAACIGGVAAMAAYAKRRQENASHMPRKRERETR